MMITKKLMTLTFAITLLSLHSGSLLAQDEDASSTACQKFKSTPRDDISVQFDRDKISFTAKEGAGLPKLHHAVADVSAYVEPRDFSISGEIRAAAGGWEHVSLRLVIEEDQLHGRELSESVAEFYCGTFDRETRRFHRTIRFIGNVPRKRIRLRLEVRSILWKERIDLSSLRIEPRDSLDSDVTKNVEAAVKNLTAEDSKTRNKAVAVLRRAGELAIKPLAAVAASPNKQGSVLAEELLKSSNADRDNRIFVDLSPRKKNRS